MDITVELRPLTPGDLRAVATIHLLAFPASALTALGPEAVRRYYDWQLRGPHEVTALGAFCKQEMVGYCFGGLFRGAMAGFLERNRGYLAWRVALHPWLLGNPLFRDRLRSGLRSLRRLYRPPAKPPASAAPKPRTFGILSIAVHPQFHGHGIGQHLMEAEEAEARAQGFERMQLTVDPDNRTAVRFYVRLGWQRNPPGAEWTGEMLKPLQPPHTA